MSKDAKIFERNDKTIRSRKPGDYGNEKTIESSPLHYDEVEDIAIQHRVRKEVLEELWAANKVNHQGHWYIRLTDVMNIVGDYNELYENESKDEK
tara:strand:- start:60 stop:344 length:285 start_codon:yes stop_codon:yes gene_type:complete